MSNHEANPSLPPLLTEITPHPVLRLQHLDAILASDSALDQDLGAVLQACGHRAIERQDLEAEAAQPITNLHELTDTSWFVFEHGRDPLKHEDEIRLAKRIEFSKQRLAWTLAGATLSADRRERIRQLTQTDPARFASSFEGVPEVDRPTFRDVLARWTEWLTFRNDLIEHNIALVEHIAMRYRTYGIPHGDLVQHGNLGLIRAADKYDWRRNVRFRTYAEWWIRQSIERATDTDREVIHVPRPMRQKLSKANRMNRAAGGPQLDATRFAELMGIDREAAAHAFAIKSGILSLDFVADEDSGPAMRDTLAGTDALEREEAEGLEHLRALLGQWLVDLPRREQAILNLRYGLDGREPKTLEEVGAELGISRERVRQLQARALGQLRDHFVGQQETLTI